MSNQTAFAFYSPMIPITPPTHPHRWTHVPERGLHIATHSHITGPNEATITRLWYRSDHDPAIYALDVTIPWPDPWAWCEVVRDVARACCADRCRPDRTSVHTLYERPRT